MIISSFNFTQIDAGEPLRPFSFVLDINDEDSYVVEDCQPPIADITLLPLLNELNESNDLSPFLRAMRKLQESKQLYLLSDFKGELYSLFI